MFADKECDLHYMFARRLERKADTDDYFHFTRPKCIINEKEEKMKAFFLSATICHDKCFVLTFMGPGVIHRWKFEVDVANLELKTAAMQGLIIPANKELLENYYKLCT